MATVFFTQQALIEIFCRVLAKGMEKDITKFHDPLVQKGFILELYINKFI